MTARTSRKRELAIAALLAANTIAEAARAICVSEKTLRRWLAEPDFQAAYRDAPAQAVTAAVGRLQGLLAKAARTLERNMDSGVPAVEVRSAVAAFELAFRPSDIAEPGARGVRGTFPFGLDALAQAQAEASAFDFSDLAREYAARFKLRAMADRMRDELRAEMERAAIDVTSGSSPTGTTSGDPDAAPSLP